MKQVSFHILPPQADAKRENTYLSFQRFIAFIEARRSAEQTMKTKLYDFVLRYFEAYPEVFQHVDTGSLAKYDHLLDLLYACLFPPLSDEQELVWALSLPNSDHVFYSTSAFHRLLAPDNPNGMSANASGEEKAAFISSLEQVKYALILERLYQIKPLVQEEIVYVWTDKRTGLSKYYSIHIDNRFVDVRRLTGEPVVNKADMRHHLKKINALCELEEAIPLTDFAFEGFSIVTGTDITARYALHKMRSAIIRHVPENFEETYKTIIYLLRSMFGKRQVEFGLLPFLKVNNRLVAYYADYSHSISINVARTQQLAEELFVARINQYFQDPQVVYFDSQTEPLQDDFFQQAFTRQGIKAYALLPVYHNNVLSGLLEVSTAAENVLDEKLLAGLEPAMPILAQLMYNNQVEFTSGIDNVIKVNFTSIQPSVQWKFNEVVWRYLKNRFEQGVPGVPGAIRFEHVYPLYGAVDIRNSTIERNDALYRDLQVYFTVLEQTLLALRAIPGEHASAEDLLEEAAVMQEELSAYISGNEEVEVLQLMERMEVFFRGLRGKNSVYASPIDAYFASVDPVTGLVFAQRRMLEQSMQLINTSVSQYLESMQAEFQRQYPVYFEKFRTDGIEYDMYIGQSINPAIPFRPEAIPDLQSWQLRSMAGIAKMVQGNQPYMPVKLHTTQLIYVNNGSIDISFRPDEKRFDAEGGYNIRYHIVKKRIDKVHIKNTGERLTQPGKIAIVYAQEHQHQQYLRYIAQLQEEGLLDGHLEDLELEELQGISGLKALRIGVVL